MEVIVPNRAANGRRPLAAGVSRRLLSILMRRGLWFAAALARTANRRMRPAQRRLPTRQRQVRTPDDERPHHVVLLVLEDVAVPRAGKVRRGRRTLLFVWRAAVPSDMPTCT